MHFSFVPVIYDAKKDVLKVSAKQKISKSDLKSFHGDLQNHLDKVAIKCNILNEATRNGNKSIEELKRKTAIKEINEKKKTQSCDSKYYLRNIGDNDAHYSQCFCRIYW